MVHRDNCPNRTRRSVMAHIIFLPDGEIGMGPRMMDGSGIETQGVEAQGAVGSQGHNIEAPPREVLRNIGQSFQTPRAQQPPNRGFIPPNLLGLRQEPVPLAVPPGPELQQLPSASPVNGNRQGSHNPLHTIGDHDHLPHNRHHPWLQAVGGEVGGLQAQMLQIREDRGALNIDNEAVRAQNVQTISINDMHGYNTHNIHEHNVHHQSQQNSDFDNDLHQNHSPSVGLTQAPHHGAVPPMIHGQLQDTSSTAGRARAIFRSSIHAQRSLRLIRQRSKRTAWVSGLTGTRDHPIEISDDIV